MSTVYVVRHGHAAGDEGDDPGLSELGRRQVRALAARLESRGITEVWHGPRRRATESAELAAQLLGVGQVRATALLDDRTPVPSAQRRNDYPAHRWAWLDEAREDERDEDGQDLTAAWRAVTRVADGKDVLLVTHAFVVGWFVREVLQAPPSAWLRLGVANTGLTVVTWNAHGEARLEAFNETLHLDDLEDVSTHVPPRASPSP